MSSGTNIKVGTQVTPSSKTKTARFSHTLFVPSNDTRQWVSTTVYVQPGAAGTETNLVCVLPLPKGVTITAVRTRMYRNAVGDFARCEFWRISSETPTNLATIDHSTTGYQTQSSAISQLVGDEEYVATVRLTGAAAPDARLVWVEVDYTMPDYSRAL